MSEDPLPLQPVTGRCAWIGAELRADPAWIVELAPAELAELVGDPWVLEQFRIENHDARDADAHVDLGVTATRGTRVKLDRRFVEADLRIATGLVEPHFMAGYSGGRKVIAPGVAHEETIRTFHSARFMEDPAAVQCNLDGNPLH